MLVDTFQRPLRNLRLSVTDRCNLRCQYCMPEAEYTWLPKQDVLTFEEIDRLVALFVGLGVDKLRLTGGEPLLRTNLPQLVAQLARHASVGDLAMTTNGILLGPFAAALKAAGLKRVTVSLDTLQRDRFVRMTRQDELPRTLAGIETAAREFPGFKIDTVVIRGVNDDEIVDLVHFARAQGGEIRFIEYMDVGGATGWTAHAGRLTRPRSSNASPTRSARSRRPRRKPPRRPIASGCPTARRSASSPRRRRRSAATATARA